MRRVESENGPGEFYLLGAPFRLSAPIAQVSKSVGQFLGRHVPNGGRERMYRPAAAPFPRRLARSGKSSRTSSWSQQASIQDQNSRSLGQRGADPSPIGMLPTTMPLIRIVAAYTHADPRPLKPRQRAMLVVSNFQRDVLEKTWRPSGTFPETVIDGIRWQKKGRAVCMRLVGSVQRKQEIAK